jgi:transcriptional regulator with XRE-family HTH domain
MSGPPLAESIAAAIRFERERAGLTVSELARRAKVAKSTLSQLEAGAGNPSIETLWALATALGVAITRLIEPPKPQVLVIRAGEGLAVVADEARYTATLLSSSPPGARRDLFRLSVEPGAVRRSQPHPPGSREHIVLSTGRAVVGPVGATVELAAGDYIAYPADVPHVFEALEPGTTGIILQEHP